MKRRYSIIFTITAAAVLVSSIAYASKKKIRANSEPRTADMSEADLTANLLDPSGGYMHKATKDGDTKKRSNEELKDLKMALKPDSTEKRLADDLHRD